MILGVICGKWCNWTKHHLENFGYNVLYQLDHMYERKIYWNRKSCEIKWAENAHNEESLREG